MVDQTAMESLKMKELPPTWPKGLLTFFIVILLFALGAYFGLNFWNQNEVSKLDILERVLEHLERNKQHTIKKNKHEKQRIHTCISIKFCIFAHFLW